MRFLGVALASVTVWGCTNLGAPPITRPGTVAEQAEQLAVRPETGHDTYQRDDWAGWDNLRPCWAVREHVLARDSIGPLTLRDRDGNRVGDETLACELTGGVWVSPFDDVTLTNPSDLDIDHIVPLAEAHRSGGAGWDGDLRRSYANDPFNLLAVSASSNRSKGDSDPSEWVPENARFVCEYLGLWVDTKIGWDLTADRAELDAIRGSGC